MKQNSNFPVGESYIQHVVALCRFGILQLRLDSLILDLAGLAQSDRQFRFRLDVRWHTA